MRGRQLGLGVERLLGEALGFTHRQPAGGDQVGQADLGGAVEGQQRPGVAHVDVARHQQLLHRCGQLQQTQQVGGSRAGAPDGLGGLLVGHAELVDEALDAAGLFEGVEVFPLDVLDEGHRQRRLVGDVPHQAGHLGEAGDLGGTPAAFAGDDFVALCVEEPALGPFQAPHQDRLHHALGLDRGGELFEGARVHAGTGLVSARLQLGGGQGLQFAPGAVAVVVVGGEEGVEATAEAFEFGRCHVRSQGFAG